MIYTRILIICIFLPLFSIEIEIPRFKRNEISKDFKAYGTIEFGDSKQFIQSKLKENEIYIWQYFIENQLLYNTSPSLQKRFIEPAPFSKFYLEIDNESPGRIGVWLGWQIIKSYISRHPKTDINAILSLPAQTIFSKSNYKPRK